jgi:hypothetical protein
MHPHIYVYFITTLIGCFERGGGVFFLNFLAVRGYHEFREVFQAAIEYHHTIPFHTWGVKIRGDGLGVKVRRRHS